MVLRVHALAFAFCAAALCALPVRAQVPPVPAPAGSVPVPTGTLPGSAPQGCSLSGLSAAPGSQPGFKADQWHLEQVSATHWKLTGQVEIECEQLKFFADEMEIFTDTDKLRASGNVVFTYPQGRISAESVDFDTKNVVGVFRQAYGIMSLGPKADVTQFGGQDPDVYFYGDTIEKLGERKYALTRGAFTTCVQPTPRWELVSGSAVITLDEHAVLRNTVLRVKGVPLMYLPWAYYPMHEDQRATGFLLPTYGASSFRGQSLSNAFFLVMGRSQDATFFHDFYSNTGQGMGAEYRYIAGQQSSGNIRFYRLNQHQTEFTTGSGVNTLPASTSYEFVGGGIQAIKGFRTYQRVDYVSDIQTQQLYHQNVARSTNSTQTIEAGLSGTRGPLTTSAVFRRVEYFSSLTRSQLAGSTPRITGSFAPQRLFGTPIYGSLITEYAYLPNKLIQDDVVTSDLSVGRFDVLPSLRAPLSKLTWLSATTTTSYRTTHYSRSFDASSRVVDEPLFRRYMSVQSDVIGPVFSRIFDTPESQRTQRIKHLIEPTLSHEYVTQIGNYRQILVTDATDGVVGGTQRLTYGLNNRFLYRGRPKDSAQGHSAEFLTVGLQQTYYSRAEASQYQYTGTGTPRLVTVSPMALIARAMLGRFQSTTRLDYDLAEGFLQSFSNTAAATFGLSSASVTYFRGRSTGSSEPTGALQGSGSVSLKENRVRGSYTFNLDTGRGTLISQAVTAAYFAQCCGLQIDLQKYNYPNNPAYPLGYDRRFNFSFVLAGLGTFTNFFGLVGQQP